MEPQDVTRFDAIINAIYWADKADEPGHERFAIESYSRRSQNWAAIAALLPED